MAAPRRLLDVGAGSGRDAAFLAGLHQGHSVVAVEPSQALASLGTMPYPGCCSGVG
ncbi:hypothetical protein [Aeromonas allosaccharophila]|uniref:hypothetical protein n=1 Tax=Aeromonas allosaccharophila TaxID=656 RepID=UPI003D1B8990